MTTTCWIFWMPVGEDGPLESLQAAIETRRPRLAKRKGRDRGILPATAIDCRNDMCRSQDGGDEEPCSRSEPEGTREATRPARRKPRASLGLYDVGWTQDVLYVFTLGLRAIGSFVAVPGESFGSVEHLLAITAATSLSGTHFCPTRQVVTLTARASDMGPRSTSLPHPHKASWSPDQRTQLPGVIVPGCLTLSRPPRRFEPHG